jgi:hypothetical protein
MLSPVAWNRFGTPVVPTSIVVPGEKGFETCTSHLMTIAPTGRTVTESHVD